MRTSLYLNAASKDFHCVYIRKRKLDKLPLGHYAGVTTSGENIP